MNKLLFALALLASCSSKPKHQTGGNLAFRENQKGIKNINDTDFISREVSKDNYCAVYIEKNRKSPLYEDLLGFIGDSSENQWYKENYKVIKKYNPNPFKIYNISGLPNDWVPLYKYKNKYYIYFPSEPGAMDRRIITDSAMVYWYMDGRYPEPFQSVEKINDHTWSFKIHVFNSFTEYEKTIIHIIDPINKIAVWEDPSETDPNKYELYIPKENAWKFDMVVNFCRENKTAEFMFDQPDYKTLLRGH
jgi:hypothetical protein